MPYPTCFMEMKNYCNNENFIVNKKLILTILLILFIRFGYSQDKEKLFSLVPSSHSNIEFNNEVIDKKEHNILIYSNYYGGAGVGIGDFNNDGFQDIFFAGNLVSDRLYMNKGDMQFEDITISAGIENNGGWSSGVIIGDVNNDGWQDIYVTRELYDKNSELRKNKLYINTTKNNPDHKITFKESAESYGLDDDARTRHATFIDYNKDGHLDIFLLNQPPNPGNFSEFYGAKLLQEKYAPRLYKNNGNQTFTDVTSKAGILKPGYANSVSVLDANNDGWQDLYISNDFEVADFFYLNNGDGTFTEITDKALRHISYFSMGVDAADINNDGNLDLMIVDMVAEDNYRIKSNMSGMNPKSFWKIVENGGHYQYMFNTLQINQGTFSGIPQFSDIAQMAGASSTDWSWSNVIADFDNDGLKDIYVTNGLMRDIRNTDSDKEVSKYVNKVVDEFVQNNPNAGDVSIWDILNLEETLSHIPSVKLINYAYKNKDGMMFEKSSEEWGLDQKTFSSGCAYGDLDNDGDLDLVVNNVNDLAYVYQNNTSKKAENNYLRVELTDNKKNKPLLGSRVEVIQGKEKQLYEFTSVRGMYSSSEQIAHFGFNKNAPIDTVKVTWPDQQRSLYTNVSQNQLIHIDIDDSVKRSDKNTSTKKRLFTATNTIDIVHKENVFDDYNKQVLLPHKMSQFGPALAVGDINGDGLEDIFVGGAAGHSPVLKIQNKSGGFKKVSVNFWMKESRYEDIDAKFFDVDNDGDNDLYVVSGGNEWKINHQNYQDRIYLNNGKGQFTYAPQALPKFTESGSSVCPFDYDNDGDLDLFIGGRHQPWDYPSPVTSRILNNEKGIFTDRTKSIAKDLIDIGMVTDAVWLDFDEDGLTDLVLTGEWMPVTFIKNTGNKFKNITDEYGIEDSEGWWYSIESADMDKDGDLDLVVGNLGLNYKYKASVNEPFEVHYEDFDQNGKKDIVLSYYNFGEQFPLRGRSCSAQQVPKIAQQIQTYNSFASANLIDVYGEANLESALHYQSKSFASAYLEKTDKGNFKIKTLPNQAQVSNINDIILEDFDGDGNMDMLMAGNMYPVEIETTRNDAGVGLFLKGNGKGEFEPIPAEKSGFFIPADVRKLALIKSNGSLMVIAVVNDGKVKSFKVNNK